MVLHLQYLIPLLVGTIAGVIGGALPGVTITMTVIVVLPFTFGLDPLQGLAAMIGVYVGGSAGGSITASLIGIPGTPSAVATTFDGFPMTKKGEAGRSVWVGAWSAFIGGALGGLCLIELTGPFASLALEFGPWEFFALFVFALSMVAGLVGRSVTKGLISGAIGLVITIVGPDPIMGQQRFTMGIHRIAGRLPLLASADRDLRLRATDAGRRADQSRRPGTVHAAQAHQPRGVAPVGAVGHRLPAVHAARG